MFRLIARILLSGLVACGLVGLAPAAEPTLPVPSNLSAEDIPAIPASLMDEIAPYTEFRTAALID